MKKSSLGSPSGSVGPSTTARNRFGLYARNRVTPLNPQSVGQQNRRASLASVSSQWRGLDEASRSAWSGYARQLPNNPSAFSAFVGANVNAAVAGLTGFIVPPARFALGLFHFTSLTAVIDGVFILTIAGTQTAPDPEAYIIWACPPVSPGILSIKSRFRVITVLGDISEFGNIAAPYIAKFGSPVLGQLIQVRIQPYSQGQIGLPFTKRAVVTGPDIPAPNFLSDGRALDMGGGVLDVGWDNPFPTGVDRIQIRVRLAGVDIAVGSPIESGDTQEVTGLTPGETYDVDARYYNSGVAVTPYGISSPVEMSV